MKVYYSSSLWSKGKGLWGFVQKINWQFEYRGAKRYIPVVYHFSKGIVFDVITILNEPKLREFIKKYETIEEDTLTPLQKRSIEQEHPYQAVPISKIWINGRRVESGYSSSSSMSIPWIEQSEELAPMRKAYSYILKDNTCFACERYCVPYPETDSKFQKLLRFLLLDRVNEIKLLTYPVQRLFALDIHFNMSVDEKGKQLCFNHPITGKKHTLYFQNEKTMEIPIKTGKNHNLHIMQSMYEIEPALPQGDILQFSSSIQYAKTPDILAGKYIPTSASSIGIIGGADGPTSIINSSKGNGKTIPCGLHGLTLHSCYSVPSFAKEDTSHFHLEGINTKHHDSKEYTLQ